MAWGQLVSMIEEAREIDAQAASAPPVECPNDYTALLAAPDGGLHCPWDGWRYPEDA